MPDAFIVAMRDALNRVLNAETPEERKEAEDAMALLIRGSRKTARPAFDPKQAAAGRDDE